MSKKLEMLRWHLRKQDPVLAGKDGEQAAREFLEALQIEYLPIEQDKDTLPREMAECGAKRPDFICWIDEGTCEVGLLDAKYHETSGSKEFVLGCKELEKYLNLRDYMKRKEPDCIFDVYFLVFPKEENLCKLVWVSLSEFYEGRETQLNGEAALGVSLLDRSDVTFRCKSRYPGTAA